MTYKWKSVPQYIGEIIAAEFPDFELPVIDANWHWYSNDFRFNTATKGGILREASMVFQCAYTIKKYEHDPNTHFRLEKERAKKEGDHE